MSIEDMRRNYSEASLEQRDLAADPIAQFQTWFDACRAAKAPDWFEPNAMTLATASASGQVSARIVLLKKLSSEGFMFFTNYESDKAKNLQDNPQASLVFYWPHLEQQVRIDGIVVKTDDATSDEYFHARPRGSQLGAIASQQSRTLDSRHSLEQLTAELAERYRDQEIPRPDYWGGYALQPNKFEFWQGRPSRLHDRFIYEPTPDGWKIARLAP